MSTEIEKPTAIQLLESEWEETGYEEVQSNADPSWRHGCRMAVVYKRESDGTFWQANYNLSGDGEYNGLRENEATITQVYPHPVTTVTYKATPVEAATRSKGE